MFSFKSSQEIKLGDTFGVQVSVGAGAGAGTGVGVGVAVGTGVGVGVAVGTGVGVGVAVGTGVGVGVAVGAGVGVGTAVAAGTGVGSGIAVGFGAKDVLEQASTKATSTTDRTIRNFNLALNYRIPICPQLYSKTPGLVPSINQPLSHSSMADVLAGDQGIFPGNPLVPITLSTKLPKQFYVHFPPWTTW
jgi:hypothetical protein